MDSNRRAFTMLETVAVLLILGLVGATAAMSLRRPRGLGDWEDVARSIADFDRTARLRAERMSRPMELVIRTRELEMRPAGDRSRDGAMSPLRLPSEFQIVQVRTVGNVTSGEQVVAISAAGRSRSYALQLAVDGERQWLLLGGLAQSVRVEDERQIHAIMEAIDRGRLDAD